MQYRKLGKSGLTASVLGIGAWSFGGGDYWGPQRQQDVEAVVRGALDRGINFFDTAEMYNNGASETSLGLALKGIRERAIIASKVIPAHAAPATLRKSCEESLHRLGTDYLDVYMMHWPISRQSISFFTRDEAVLANPPSVEEAFSTLAALRQEGKIRAIGLSNHGVRQIEQVLGTVSDIAVNQLCYSLLSRAIEAAILPACVRHDIAIIGYMPLHQGLLSGRFASLDDVPPVRMRTRHFDPSRGKARHTEAGAEPEMIQALAAIREIAAGAHVAMGTLALAWAIANDAVATTIVGCRTVAELSENAAAVDCVLTPDVMQQLDVATRPLWEKLGDNPDYYENRTSSRVV